MRLGPLLTVLLLMPQLASAFCGFFVSGADSKLYNNASQVVLMRHGQRTVLTMSNAYHGPTEDFAMVVPVPVVLQKDQVNTLPHDVFKKIDQLSAPRLVEYWEQDPCHQPIAKIELEQLGEGRSFLPFKSSKPRPSTHGVTIEAQFKAGEYEILILSAKEANGLEAWLTKHKYTLPTGAAEALAPYVRSGMKFFVAKVDIKKVKRDAEGAVKLSPLRFHYEDAQLRLPVRLGLLNAQGEQDLIVYVLHATSRFEVANYKNIFIPSNLEVLDDVREDFGAFYAELFDKTLASAGGRAVVTEYAWQASSCDPCPVSALQLDDLQVLGGSVLNRSPRSWVLTRLHTRYNKKTLNEDLIFTEAGPVVGGRGSAGLSREKPGAVEKSSANNFQGRYIIRNYWAGKVTCDNPRWGNWGGPPSGANKIKAATKLASAKRGAVQLNKVVRSALPRLSLPGLPTPTHRK